MLSEAPDPWATLAMRSIERPLGARKRTRAPSLTGFVSIHMARFIWDHPREAHTGPCGTFWLVYES